MAVCINNNLAKRTSIIPIIGITLFKYIIRFTNIRRIGINNQFVLISLFKIPI